MLYTVTFQSMTDCIHDGDPICLRGTEKFLSPNDVITLITP